MNTTRTEFGKANSVYRRDANLKLRQVAEYLGVSPAFLTNVEVGKKSVPEEWPERLSKLYKLDPLQGKMLQRAALVSKKRFVIEVNNEKEAELLAAFVQNRNRFENGQIDKAINDLSANDSEVHCDETEAPAQYSA